MDTGISIYYSKEAVHTIFALTSVVLSRDVNYFTNLAIDGRMKAVVISGRQAEDC